MEKKITRRKFLSKKFKEWEKTLVECLPEEDYSIEFENILNDIKEILC